MKVFKEEQRFSQSWLIALIIISTIVPLIIVIKKYLDKNISVETSEFIGTIGLMLALTSFIFFCKLKTRIDEKGVYYQFVPFHFSLKLISWNQIQTAQIRKYDAITEYGGWGLKSVALWNRSRGKSITVSGNIGIQLVLKDGKKILIGTQNEQDARRVLTQYINRTENNEN
ncbi:hypothetical protein GCM10011416_19240 [Polaribacter pacificus]|uniref:Uncharacterized protein n=1 Tax=Polaribacter pacificus TaxID=1775173 RepID=A0A917MGK9_9FLAO|nr:hypothetical protein [Polaribacter pacificus]GGH00726.1 hypothetical protein GCM10011416_19240 [Polaribacter pacificus]